MTWRKAILPLFFMAVWALVMYWKLAQMTHEPTNTTESVMERDY